MNTKIAVACERARYGSVDRFIATFAGRPIKSPLYRQPARGRLFFTQSSPTGNEKGPQRTSTSLGAGVPALLADLQPTHRLEISLV